MINETKIKVQHITFKSTGTCSGCGVSGWGWGVWGGLGSVDWSLGHQWQKSMTDMYQINILATFKLEQICKISLK